MRRRQRGWLATWLQARRRARVAGLPAPPFIGAVTLHTDLVGYWKLDEAAYETRADASGNGLNLFEYAPWFPEDPPFVGQVAGKIGNAIELTEYGAGVLVNQTMPDIANGDLSAALWVYPVMGSYGGQYLFCLGSGFTFRLAMWSYFGIAVNLTATDDQGASTYDLEIGTADGTLMFGVWAHFAFVKQEHTIKIYINGVEQTSGTFTGDIVKMASVYFNSTDLMVGTSPWGYPGISPMDELGLWQRALSAAEVAQLYNEGDGLPYEGF